MLEQDRWHGEAPLDEVGTVTDFGLERGGERVLVEVKNVTLLCAPDVACFPDAVTTRGQRHLRELLAPFLETVEQTTITRRRRAARRRRRRSRR